jgi:sulfite reductase (NADPH) flavoprotein alpha-component
MLNETKHELLSTLVKQASKEELIWIQGYLAGVVAGNGAADLGEVAKPAANKKITLVYGTETGNAKKLASQLAGIGKKKGVNVKLTGLDQYRITDLTKEELLFVVISTQGEGEPPASAKKFYEYIQANQLQLPHLKYGVLALGDSSYPLFCQTGIDVDEKFTQFGATRIVPLQKCDVDYEETALAWFNEVLNTTAAQTAVPETKPAAAPKTGGKKYYEGKIIASVNLNDRGSKKETYHIEITTDELVSYEPGDAIGIVPPNRLTIVDRIIELTGVDGQAVVETGKVSADIKTILTQHVNVCYLLLPTIKKYAAITEQEIPEIRMDLVDLLRIYPVKNPDQFIEVIKVLTPIAPRLYSLASAPAAHGDNEVHITVSKNTFVTDDERRYGLCSEFLGDQPVNTGITFYVHKNKAFKLPDAEKDIIMIGPGTGVAPFRSFLAERDAAGATGKNWLFFGEQHFVTDFLYQVEMQKYMETGVLTNLDLAFSRDQQQKIYVQHKMQQKSSELYNWLNNGAALYVCGAREPMASDVEQTLINIISEQGNKTTDEAAAFLLQLQEEGRYEKDVY